MTIHGSCLCGGVAILIEGKVSPIGLCHCSKCRKQTGTAAATELMTAAGSLRYERGESLVTEYAQPSGYTTRFCRICGSLLPRLHPNGKILWVPAGLLDDDPGVEVAMHIYVDSKAPWDVIADDRPQFPEECHPLPVEGRRRVPTTQALWPRPR